MTATTSLGECHINEDSFFEQMSSKTAYTSVNSYEATVMQANNKRKRNCRKGHKKGRSRRNIMICKESHTNIEEISRVSVNPHIISSSEFFGAEIKVIEGHCIREEQGPSAMLD